MSKKNMTSPNVDESKFAPAGLKWLYEMESLNSPALLNNLYGNIYSFPNVSDCEILIDRHSRKMLIYIKFTWLVRKVLKFRKKETTISILDQLQELLPSFEFRIIEDKNLFDLAVQRLEQSLSGGKNAEIIKDSDNLTTITAATGNTGSPSRPISSDPTSNKSGSSGSNSDESSGA